MIDAIAGLGPQIVAPFVDEFRVSFGRSRREHFRRLYAHHLGGDELGWEDFYAVYGGAYGALVRARYGDAPLCAHAASLVRSLSAAGVPMTIVTGTPSAEAEAVLRAHGLDGAFAAILGGEQHKSVRVREALKLTSSSRSRCRHRRQPRRPGGRQPEPRARGVRRALFAGSRGRDARDRPRRAGLGRARPRPGGRAAPARLVADLAARRATRSPFGGRREACQVAA